VGLDGGARPAARLSQSDEGRESGIDGATGEEGETGGDDWTWRGATKADGAVVGGNKAGAPEATASTTRAGRLSGGRRVGVVGGERRMVTGSETGRAAEGEGGGERGMVTGSATGGAGVGETGVAGGAAGGEDGAVVGATVSALLLLLLLLLLLPLELLDPSELLELLELTGSLELTDPLDRTTAGDATELLELLELLVPLALVELTAASSDPSPGSKTSREGRSGDAVSGVRRLMPRACEMCSTAASGTPTQVESATESTPSADGCVSGPGTRTWTNALPPKSTSTGGARQLPAETSIDICLSKS